MNRLISVVTIIACLLISNIAMGSELASIQKLNVLRDLPNAQGGVSYMSTASISELHKYYKTQLDDLGWSVVDEATDDKSFGNANFIKNSEYLAFTMGANPAAKPPMVIVSLVPIGAISSASLDYYPSAEAIYTSPATSIYVTADSVPSVAEKTSELLKEDGWRVATETGADTRQFMTFEKAGSALTVTVQQAPAQGNKTTIQYGMTKAR